MDTKPTHEQAQLHLQVFEMRREPRLREARDWFQNNFHPAGFADAMQIAPMGTEHGTFVGMVLGYWDQACTLLNYGLLHDGLFFTTSPEFHRVWEAIKPALPEFRAQFNYPIMLENLEQAAQRFEIWSEERAPGHLASMRQMSQQAAAAKTS